MRFTLGKSERIKSRKLMEQMFVEGSSVKQYPFRLVWLETTEPEGVQMGVSVPKKRIKKAVNRNRVKRLIKEAFRLNKPQMLGALKGNYAIMIIYMDSSILPFDEACLKIKKLLERFINEIESKYDEKVDQ